VQRKQVEVLRNKLREGQGKQREFCSQMNQSIMQSVIKVIGGANNTSSSAGANSLNKSGINKG
jgi:hypothetical protein